MMIANGPSGSPIVTKNNSDAIAMTISGTISVVYMTESKAARDLRPTFRSPMAAAVPMTVARIAFTAAVHSDSVSAPVIDSSAHVIAHQSRPNPRQT
jgi:hypothetical protein